MCIYIGTQGGVLVDMYERTHTGGRGGGGMPYLLAKRVPKWHNIQNDGRIVRRIPS